ncbi:hypothetical protein GGS21DRAFT_310508 [Xylaria nigripes]|nr:hypothetical protein GGS21DRAFT_310508 [Xylaria nigripes]
MPRLVDTLPTPAHVRPMKLIVLNPSRNATLGTYIALKQLGFRPYHLAETSAAGGWAFRVLEDAAKADLRHDGQPYGREEFDKLLWDYDCITELPFLMLRSILKAYPDAKFLLVERNPEKWAKSYLATVGRASLVFDNFPMSVFQYFDAWAYYTHRLGRVMSGYYTNELGASEKGRRALIENYKEYIADVKRLVPPDKLKVVRLEDGYGWNELCPCLGVPIPDTPWPFFNTQDEFKSSVGPMVRRAMIKGMFGVVIITSATAVGLWYAGPYIRRALLNWLA